MKTFDLETLHPTIKDNVVNVLKELGISIDKIGLCGQEGNFPLAEMAAIKIMQSGGLSFDLCKIALNGIPPQDCDTEFSDNWNWSRCYDGAMLLYAIKFANKYFTKIGNFEVGMKYPMFRKHLLINKFKLNHIGTFETKHSKTRPVDQKIFYEVWQDQDKNYSFSFESGRMGKGGYAGLVVKTVEQAIDFCKWYLSKKSFFVKDMDLFINGLGGFGESELKDLNLL